MQTIINNFIGEGITDGMLKETGTVHWGTGNTKSTKQSGFTALSGGSGYYDDMHEVWEIEFPGSIGYWWPSTEYSSVQARRIQIESSFSTIFSFPDYKTYFLSVRCIKD